MMAVATATLVGLDAGPAAAVSTNDPLFGEQYGLVDIKAPEAWDRGAGAGIRVAVVSSGIGRHQDLAAKTDGGADTTGGNDPSKDISGRGTHLAGIVGAATNNTEGIAGVAPDARLLPYRAFSTDKAIATDKYIEALQMVAGARPQVALVDVPSSFPVDGRDLLRQALLGMARAGISVVVGAQSDVPLGDLPVLTVASTTAAGDQDPTTAGVGAEGVSAPGQGITSTTAATTLLGETTFGYGALSGTAQAAAHVAGAVAILRSAGANPGQAANLLRSTARKSGNPGLGAGRIDVAAAIGAFKKPSAPAATTTTTKKAAAPPTTSRATGTAAIPRSQPGPTGPAGAEAGGDLVEPGEGEAAVVPSGAEAFYQDGDGGQRVTIVTEGKDRPIGALTVGFGLLFGVGTGLSVTFRRLAAAAA